MFSQEFRPIGVILPSLNRLAAIFLLIHPMRRMTSEESSTGGELDVEPDHIVLSASESCAREYCDNDDPRDGSIGILHFTGLDS